MEFIKMKTRKKYKDELIETCFKEDFDRKVQINIFEILLDIRDLLKKEQGK